MTSIERLPTSAFLRETAPPFADKYKLHSIFSKLFGQVSVILVGPKGVGKSLAVHSWAVQEKIPVVSVDCSEDLRASRLLGSFVLRGDQTPYVLGPIPTAFEIANETGKCILDFEELNSLAPQAQKILNPLLDFRRRIEVPEAQRVFELRKDATLWVVGSMNFTGYGGVHQLNEDLLSRVELLRVGYPDTAEEKDILRVALPAEVFEAVSKPVGEGGPSFLEGVLRLAKETRQEKGVDYALSPRDVERAARMFPLLGLKRTLRLLMGKHEGDSLSTMRLRASSIFPGLTFPEG